VIFQNCLKYNFEISLVVFMPNITTNHAITYTNSRDHWYWYIEITSHRHEKKQGLMPSPPKLDLPKPKSQISRRADDSIRVFARPVWQR